VKGLRVLRNVCEINSNTKELATPFTALGERVGWCG
jgi:hypothetical protein